MGAEQSHKEWDNRILEFDGEDFVCIGRTFERSLKAEAEISYQLAKVSVELIGINDEIWVPLAQLFMALEALNGNPVFCKNDSDEDWSVNAPVPKRTLYLGEPVEESENRLRKD